MPSMNFQESMKNILFNGSYSDAKVTCQQSIFNVHCAIICPQSPFFEKALNSGFKESYEKRVDLPDDDPQIIQRVISFLYTQNYDEEGYEQLPEYWALHLLDTTANKKTEQENSAINTAPRERGLVHLKILQAADKLDIGHLKAYVIERFAIWSSNNWKSRDYLDIANQAMKIAPLDTKLNCVIAETITSHLYHFGELEEFEYFLSHNGAMSIRIIKYTMFERDLRKKPIFDQVRYLNDVVQEMNKTGKHCSQCKATTMVRRKNISPYMDWIVCFWCSTAIACIENDCLFS